MAEKNLEFEFKDPAGKLHRMTLRVRKLQVDDVVGWEGVYEDGKPVPFTPENFERLRPFIEEALK